MYTQLEFWGQYKNSFKEESMNIFEFDKTNYRVHPTPEAINLKVFGDIWKRDKSKDKELALKELSFVWFYCDVRSHFLILTPEVRVGEIIKDVNLPKDWKPDKLVKAAIEYYENNRTMLEEMYEGALMAAQTITEVCKNSRDYITTSDDKVVAAQKLNGMLKDLPTSMAKLKEAESQYLKEMNEKSSKGKATERANTFEDGI